MIHFESLAQSRQVDLEAIKTPLKQECKVHKLGGLKTAFSFKEPVGTMKQTTVRKIASQQVVFTFSNSNPLSQLHKVIHFHPSKTHPTQRTFRDVIQEVHEMKEICEKLMTPEKEPCHQQYHKTLIMDLQKLQTNRADLDTVQSNMLESKISIKGQIAQDVYFCLHGKCQEVNGILENALSRLNELENDNQKLEKILADEKQSKQMVESENLHLRAEIARIDDEKCQEIKKLKQQLERLQRQKQNILHQSQQRQQSQARIYGADKIAMSNVSQKASKQPQVIKQRPALASIQVQQNLQESIFVPQAHEQVVSAIAQKSIKKLKHAVYL